MINYSIIKKCLSVRLFCLLLLMFSATIVFSQKRTISGNVVDEIKEPLIGVTVQVKGTTQGTVTDLDGNYSILVVAVTNSSKHDFNHCKSVVYKFLSRDPKSARDKNGTKPRKNKVKNTLPEISLVEYLCFVCKGTNLSLEKRGEIPISLIHNSFSYHCTPNVVIASDFALKQHDLRKSGVKYCFSL